MRFYSLVFGCDSSVCSVVDRCSVPCRAVGRYVCVPFRGSMGAPLLVGTMGNNLSIEYFEQGYVKRGLL